MELMRNNKFGLYNTEYELSCLSCGYIFVTDFGEENLYLGFSKDGLIEMKCPKCGIVSKMKKRCLIDEQMILSQSCKYDDGIIYQGDCLKVLPLLPDNCVDLVVTSPPYNIGVDYGICKDNMSWDDYYIWCEKWLREIFRLLKDDGRFCLVHYLSCGNSEQRQAPLMKLNVIAENIGYYHHGLAIWWDATIAKPTAWGSWLSATAPYVNSPFEGVVILYKQKWKKEKTGKTEISKEEFMESCSGIWKISPERNRLHPAPFPKKLVSRCIKLLSYIGDTVLDPFMGSGTVGVVCGELNRKFIGIEIEPKYFEIAKRRIGNVTRRDLFLDSDEG